MRLAYGDAGVDYQAMNVDMIPDVAALGLDPMGVGLNNTIFTTLVFSC